LGKLAPDHKTIADFRKDNLKALRAVNRQFTLLCRQLGLFGGQLLAVDGSKFGAVNARDQNFNAEKLQDLLARADARLAEYLSELDGADAAEPAAAPLDKTQLAAKIAALQERQDWHRELLAQLQDGEEKQVSVTDPDTRKMPTAHGTIVGYNAQLAVDAKHKLIAADDVTNDVTDYQQLAEVALAAKANEGLMEAMAARMKAQPWKFKLRKTLAEHPFGTIKRWFGYTHFLMKGLEKVRAEWSLTTLAYNLKRVLNLVSFEQLMMAVGAKMPPRA